MEFKSYEDMDEISLDVMKEVGSIGTGTAATALSGLLNEKVKMTIPDVKIFGYNESIDYIGNPEDIVAGVLSEMSGDMKGIMLFLMELDFINEVLRCVSLPAIEDCSMLDEMGISALEEVGNIVISAYMTSLSKLADMDIHLSVPAVSVNMLGGIMAVPMVSLGLETNKVLMITGKFVIGGKQVDSNLLMLPDIESLNSLMNRLVRLDG